MKTVNATGNGRGQEVAKECCHRSSAAFSGRLFRRSRGHDDDTVCPQEKVGHRGKCSDVEYALCSEQSVDQRPEKSVQKLPVEIRLIGLEDQERHHEQKQKIGELADGPGIQETGLINQNAAEKNEKHLSGFEDYGRSHGYR